MKLLFVLSKQDLLLSSAEVIELLRLKKFSTDANLLVAESMNTSLIERLAYTKSCHRLLFKCTPKQLVTNVKNFNWQKIYKKDFSVEIKGKHMYTEAELADIIWEKLNKPKANLKNALTKITFFINNKYAYACLQIWRNQEDFNSRKAHNRPELHPSSLHPRLARCCINLTGLRKGSITDPFCGSGGILIEAGLMGLKTVGFDNDDIMLRRAKINLDYYKIKNYKLDNRDSSTLTKSISYIVTDLPYGKNTKMKDNIYSAFLKSLEIGKRAVIIFPNFYHPVFKKFKVIRQFNYYLHKSLSKRIILIEKRR